MNIFKPLLNVYLIWHPAADAACRPLAQAIFTKINRHPERPFARGIGIPTYYRCVPAANQNIPLAIDVTTAEHTVIFVLVEDHLVFDEAWGQYVADVYAQTQTGPGIHLFVPVALTGSAFNLHPDISKANFVRLFNLDAEAVQSKLIHYVVHALARLLANPERTTEQGVKLSPLPVKLFISHTKREAKALQLAEALKQALDNTQLARFFDSVDIASGFQFDKEIDANIEGAALIAIRSDRYSDSPWCRLEVMSAKRLKCPIIVVDVLQDHEDRSFSYLSNVPVIRFDLEQSLTAPETTKKLQAIIDFALLEVLRFKYIEQHLNHLKKLGWLPDDVTILSRPPEERDLKSLDTKKQIIYPDPPLGYEESKELASYDKQLDTPTTLRGKSLQGQAIGISISESDPGELQALGLSNEHLQIAMLEVARQCLAQGAQLVYGGDLRPNGFTEDLLELVRYHNDALKKEYQPISNYLAWPLKATLEIAWAAQNKDAISIKVQKAPEDLLKAGLITNPNNPGPINEISGYIWARCLTAMREQIVQITRARIMMGGRTTGFKGKYPGLVEEALLTLQAKKPLFLLGGYGGASHAICQALQGLQPEALTEAYQCANKSYENLLQEYNLRVAGQPDLEPINYQAVGKTFTEIGLSGLNNGLSVEENLTLFATINNEEAIGLILMGLARVNKAKIL